MTGSGVDAWITSAVREEEVMRVLLLAGSFRRVGTAKKLVVLATTAIYETSSEELKKIFDSVVVFKPQDGLDNVDMFENWAKVEALSLVLFNKCVYVSPNTLVLKNCDEIFDKYDNFAAWGNKAEVDSSVFLFTPCLDNGNAFRKMVHAGMGTGSFQKCFNLWIENHIPNWEKLDDQYNVSMSLTSGCPKSLCSTITIANFGDGAHPRDYADDGVYSGRKMGWGPIEKFVVELGGIINGQAAKFKPNSGLVAPVSTIHSKVYKTEPIAIVGMSFRLPGSNNVDEFWNLMINGKDAIIDLPESRWLREHTNFPCYNRNVRGGFLQPTWNEFDNKFFGIGKKDAEALDPQQRLLHEVTWEAFEDAMIDPATIRGTQTGVFVGSWLHDFKDMVVKTSDRDFFRGYMGTSIASGAARLSHFLETTGPSIATESGCSSSIVAVDLACKSLRNHDCSLALACGVNLLLKPFDQNTFSFVVSPEGRCKTFDEGADGFGRAEGCAVLLLKRLSDAVRDDDKIWGLIRGSAVTQEGVSKSLGTPTVYCESLAMKLALKDAKVFPGDVSYIEAHGTGTPLGDTLEIDAITEAYSNGRSEPLLIGSVKTNVGHTESVSGLTGIIKVLLSMKNEKIPKHLNLTKLNPWMRLDAIPAIIPLETMSWNKQHDKPRIAGVSSFGISGTDGHVIIQEPPLGSLQQICKVDVLPRPLHIMKISAKSPESFRELLSVYGDIFDSNENDSDGFANMAYSANAGRSTFNHRAVILAKDFNQALIALKSNSFKHAEVKSRGSHLCFLFTGQGSQYPSMGSTLYATSPIFHNEFNKCDKVLAMRYGIKLKEVLWGQSTEKTDLNRTLYSQTSIFCIEYCLLKLWESWGIRPDYVMGHSLGEFAAAVAAGALDFEDALMLVAERSRLIDRLPRGKMLVIRSDYETVDNLIEEYKQGNPTFWVDKAAINSLDQTVVAGDSIMIEEFAKFCGERSLKTIVLPATHAFHSRHMDPMLDKYRKVAQATKPFRAGKDSPKYISGMEGKIIDLESIDADYWVRHTREPVRFTDSCIAAQAEGITLFMEVGPHPVLSALTMMNLESSSVVCLPSIRKNEDEWVTMLDSLAKLFLSDWKGQVDWNGFDRYYNRTRVSLPFYPFNRKSVRTNLESDLPDIHPLLGRPIPTECDHTIFTNKLFLKSNSFVQDHVIGSTVIFPGAAFLEMCLTGGHASAQVTATSIERNKPQRPVALKSLRITSPLAFYDSVLVQLQTTASLDTNDKDEIIYKVGVHRYVPSATDGVGEWITHSTGDYFPIPGTDVRSLPNLIDIPFIKSSWEVTGSKDFYDKLPEVGLRFGPKFRSLGMGWKNENGMLIKVKVPEGNDQDDRYLIHPVIGDSMIQATMLWTSKNDKTNKMKLQVPIGIEEFMWFEASKSSDRYIYCWTNEHGKTVCLLLDAEGTHLARMTGVEFIETSVKMIEGMLQEQDAAMPRLWREVWKNDSGALESAYDFVLTRENQFLQYNDNQCQALAEGNDVGEYERNFYRNICNISKLYFLKAMYEMGWSPTQGANFTFRELVAMLPQPKEHFKRYIHFFLRELVNTGLLVADSVNGNTFQFVDQPPTPAEVANGIGKVVSDRDLSRGEYLMVMEIGRHLTQIWQGKVDALQILFPEDSAKVNAGQCYAISANWSLPVLKQTNEVLFAEIIDSCHAACIENKHAPPTLRVLEVGAGSGALSEHFLGFLKNWGRPFEYCYTDISASFFNAAEKRLEKYGKHLIFKKFDMEEDPLSQGFCPNYFDVICAYEVLHVVQESSPRPRFPPSKTHINPCYALCPCLQRWRHDYAMERKTRGRELLSCWSSILQIENPLTLFRFRG